MGIKDIKKISRVFPLERKKIRRIVAPFDYVKVY
jgi:hypothetical protein